MPSSTEILNSIKSRAFNNEPVDLDDLLKVAQAPLNDLIEASHEVTVALANPIFNFCAIVNAKSGKCSENCRWCAQSRHFNTKCEVYPLLDAENIIKCAKAAEASGVTRFSLVTRGRKLSPREVPETATIVHHLKQNN